MISRTTSALLLWLTVSGVFGMHAPSRSAQAPTPMYVNTDDRTWIELDPEFRKLMDNYFVGFKQVITSIGGPFCDPSMPKSKALREEQGEWVPCQPRKDREAKTYLIVPSGNQDALCIEATVYWVDSANGSSCSTERKVAVRAITPRSFIAGGPNAIDKLNHLRETLQKLPHWYTTKFDVEVIEH